MRSRTSLFLKINVLTIFAVYLLILAGSVVRVTGSGMGCPDWPKCFGSYVPPSDNSELPEGYKDYFLEQRQSKNARLQKYLSAIGLSGVAQRISEDPKVSEVYDYNLTTAWIEYLNRLLGALIGVFILVYAGLSLRFFRQKKVITMVAVLVLLLVLAQAWIGSLVVSTNLIPGFISFHMALALLLIVLLIYTFFLAKDERRGYTRYRELSGWILVLFIPQVFLGTQVRETVEFYLSEGLLRSSIVDKFSTVFYIHRTFSLFILFLSLKGLYTLHKQGLMNTRFAKIWTGTSVILVAEILGGAIMAYFNIPRWVQPLHLLGGSVLLGMMYHTWLQTKLNLQT